MDRAASWTAPGSPRRATRRTASPGNVKVPFWLQPEKHYLGAVWYQRDVAVPPEWKGRRLVLSLERPHWETLVWLDDRAGGLQRQPLDAPRVRPRHRGRRPGRTGSPIRVDNRMVVDVGRDSHSVSDHTQGNWNGIVGRIELRATAPVFIDDLQVFPAGGVPVDRGRRGESATPPVRAGRGTSG